MALDEIHRGREKLGLTQKQFANLLGVGEATVSRWETGRKFGNAPWTDSFGSALPARRPWSCCRAISSRARGVRNYLIRTGQG